MQSNVEVGERIKFVASNSTTATYRAVRLANGTIAYKWEHGDLTSAEVNFLHSRIVKEYVVLKIRNATLKYNCHSYAWYSKSTGNKYWIDDPSKFSSKADVVFTQQPKSAKLPAAAKKDDRVINYNGNKKDHSAIVYKPNIKGENLISKWGFSGLYSHSINNCPYYLSAAKIEYYRLP